MCSHSYITHPKPPTKPNLELGPLGVQVLALRGEGLRKVWENSAGRGNGGWGKEKREKRGQGGQGRRRPTPGGQGQLGAHAFTQAAARTA